MLVVRKRQPEVIRGIFGAVQWESSDFLRLHPFGRKTPCMVDIGLHHASSLQFLYAWVGTWQVRYILWESKSQIFKFTEAEESFILTTRKFRDCVHFHKLHNSCSPRFFVLKEWKQLNPLNTGAIPTETPGERRRIPPIPTLSLAERARPIVSPNIFVFSAITSHNWFLENCASKLKCDR